MGADESSLQELDDSPEASARRAVASGSVDDYDDTKRSAIASKLATAAGVDASDVTVVVTAASVQVSATIRTSTASGSASVANALSTRLADPSSATALLGVPVESAVTLEAKVKRVEVAAPPPPDASGERMTLLIIIGVASGVVVVGLVVMVMACLRSTTGRQRGAGANGVAGEAMTPSKGQVSYKV